MSPPKYLFAYGVGLGAGLFTRIRSFSLIAVVALVFLVVDLGPALMVGMVYAFSRGGPLLAAAAIASPAEEFEARLERLAQPFYLLDAALLVAIGGLLIAL
jgi:hypothetical protein